ncbi:natriuretic peptides A [Amia ocellicauda]|uniref:natriuretic peptides A n=1 Tax=Amia ocellicauda TaxID=2972642 RepID=UPI003463FDF3|nr:ANF protein [Amia calva]
MGTTHTAILAGFLVLLCQQVVVSQFSNPGLENFGRVMEQLEKKYREEEAMKNARDYQNLNQEAEDSETDPWSDPETVRLNNQARMTRLIDLLFGGREKSASGCFGRRMDRIGSMSALGCGGSKKG